MSDEAEFSYKVTDFIIQMMKAVWSGMIGKLELNGRGLLESIKEMRLQMDIHWKIKLC